VKWLSRRPRKIPREAAIGGRPLRRSAISREKDESGKTRITLTAPAPGWLRLVRGPKEIERTFRLDPLGLEVYEACDGETDVKTMVSRFAKRHRISEAEAEVAVTTFLKTMMARGLVVIEVDRHTR
jgi:hypothetical protein